MTRKECLEQAMGCVLKDRASQYGTPEDNFGRIARLWTAYTGIVLDGIDVAMMMALLKIARIRNNKAHGDSFVDLSGYAACGAELAGRAEAYRQSIEEAGEEYKKLRAKAEGDAKAEGWEELAMADAEEVEKAFGKPDSGCFQNGKDHSPEEPEFRPGDAIEWNSIDGTWRPAVFLREAKEPVRCVIMKPDGYEMITSRSYIRKADPLSFEEQAKTFARENPPEEPEGNHPENPDSSTGTDFNPGEKVEVHSITTKVWQEATIVDADKEHTLYRIRFPDGTVSIRPACYVRHVVKEDKPQAEGCEELVSRIKEVNPAIYGEKKEQD